jgi:hypothetical protein
MRLANLPCWKFVYSCSMLLPGTPGLPETAEWLLKRGPLSLKIYSGLSSCSLRQTSFPLAPTGTCIITSRIGRRRRDMAFLYRRKPFVARTHFEPSIRIRTNGLSTCLYLDLHFTSVSTTLTFTIYHGHFIDSPRASSLV